MTIARSHAPGATPDRPSPGARREILAAVGITRSFGAHTALDNIDLVIERGEFLALLGPSGCGKTTLLKVIAGLQEPTGGEIRIDGRDMTAVPANRRPVNTVFQNYALFPHMPVFENVAFGPRRARLPAQEIRDAVQAALKLVGMSELAERYPAQLSGGQQQRVALARAIVNRPAVLLLDEPLAALDLQLRKRMQLELKSLQRHLGMTFVFVTHDQDEALTMADRIVVMNQGRIEQVGSGREIYDEPATRFVGGFIGEANFIDLPREALRGPETRSPSPAQLMVRPESIQIAAQAPDETVFQFLRGHIVQKVFKGPFVSYICRTPAGGEIAVTQAVSDAKCAVDEDVYLSWHPRSARRFAAT
ncbi:MAG: ABC transporter ATP-binding protein [Parvibaculaceae bacterium]